MVLYPRIDLWNALRKKRWTKEKRAFICQARFRNSLRSPIFWPQLAERN
ncbi:hypothetical protein PCA20602_03697 [Pandoraea capi]|uniref:Uncharacterized protein n=1 Tax=Pandoraea capi TaxID=2508286 RepID=A0ABY6W6B0_9BURK|nr:hypothetical protein PCA20602_03697 [Pandoraea capi]